MVRQALEQDEKGNKEEALELYLQTTELCLQAVSRQMFRWVDKLLDVDAVTLLHLLLVLFYVEISLVTRLPTLSCLVRLISRRTGFSAQMVTF